MTGVVVLLGALVLASLIGFGRKALDGRVRRGARDESKRGANLPEPVAAALDPAAAVTLVQLSTTFCSACRQTGTLLSALATGTAGVSHVELDVTDRPAVATGLGVMRTPTTLALTPDGRELLRISGVPKTAELLTALRPHLAGAVA